MDEQMFHCFVNPMMYQDVSNVEVDFVELLWCVYVAKFNREMFLNSSIAV